MANGWTLKRRARQAKLIHRWKPFPCGRAYREALITVSALKK
jgi:hypothetical protein